MKDQHSVFQVGEVYHRRKDLHDIYGGNRQSGIASCADYPYVFLFSAPTGEEFGYQDGWVSPDDYVYTGEGQHGDMDLRRGNRSILDHQENGKQLHLFELRKAGEYTYLGEFEFRSYEYVRGKDALDHDRQIIRFHLTPIARAASDNR